MDSEQEREEERTLGRAEVQGVPEVMLKMNHQVSELVSEMRDRRLVDQVMAKTRGSQDDIRSSSGGNDRTSISINTGDSHSGSNSGGEDEGSRKNSDSNSSDTKHVGIMEKKSENKRGAEEK